jgi:TusA-related sulfurtransferase
MSTPFELDITKEHCPMTFVKTKLKLDTLATGDRLKIRLRAGEPLENVPRSSEEQGHRVISIQHLESEIYEIVIEKG